jgi:tRNA pseudouridine55 synthase
MESILLINKPKGMTSHDVVYRVRKATGIKKVGHGGTLDPNATGLLVIGVGREGTKQLGNFTTGMSKTYEAEIILGATSTTEDAEGEILKNNSAKKPTREEIERVLLKFEGEQMQVPSAHSAIKIKGKKAYQLARAGKEVKLEPRKITVYSIKLLRYDYPRLEISCDVSSGTYIRALARDIGKELGTGAYLNNLKRTKIGEYSLKDAIEIEELNGNS